jgi:carboxypeptidase C (cathepsin A)
MKIKMLNATLLGVSLLLGSTAAHSANLNVVAGAKADLVESLPKYGKPKSAHYSGYLAVQSALPTSTTEQVYYYLATAQNDVKDDAPVILWLNGGPGSSSFYGFFTENGPYTVGGDAELKDNPFAWNKRSNFLIFDQPLGVGYSYPSKQYQIKDEKQTTHELYLALQAFYAKFPGLKKRKLFIVGESYAGRYIPEVAVEILKQNKQNTANKIPLTGIMLGDAWVNPLLQQSQDADYAYSHGLIDYNGKKMVESFYAACAQGIQSEVISSKATNAKCGRMVDFIRDKSGIDLHNINNLMPNESNNAYALEYKSLADYLNRSDVRHALHVNSNESFNLYSEFVGNALEVGIQNSAAPLIRELLNQKLNVLIYNGMNDAKDCNFMGTNLWLRELNWQQFNQTSQKPFLNREGKIIGYLTQYNNLSYIKMFNGGHMLPEDQPENSLYMINQFVGIFN